MTMPTDKIYTKCRNGKIVKTEQAPQGCQHRHCVDASGSSQPETEAELLKLAIFWMRKTCEYDPPRYQDLSRMARCASYIEERMNEKNTND